MPIDLAKLSAKQVKVVVDIDGEKLNIEYRPNLITPKLYAELSKVEGESDQPAFLAAVLSSWDLENNGKPVKLTVAAITEVPMALLNQVVIAVWTDMRPNPASPAASTSSFS